MRLQSKKGLTLVEIVVAVAILGFMAAGILTGVIYSRDTATKNQIATRNSVAATGILDQIINTVPAGNFVTYYVDEATQEISVHLTHADRNGRSVCLLDEVCGATYVESRSDFAESRRFGYAEYTLEPCTSAMSLGKTDAEAALMTSNPVIGYYVYLRFFTDDGYLELTGFTSDTGGTFE